MSDPVSDPAPAADPAALQDEVRRLREEVSRLNDHKFLRTYNSVPRFMAFNFARGLMVGLGTVIGATLLLSVFVWSLSQIEFIPILGEWAKQISDIVTAEPE